MTALTQISCGRIHVQCWE